MACCGGRKLPEHGRRLTSQAARIVTDGQTPLASSVLLRGRNMTERGQARAKLLRQHLTQCAIWRITEQRER